MEKEHMNFYANAINMASSIYDITFDLKSQSPHIDQTGKILQLNGQPVINVSEEITVRMSPQHAKAFAVLLVKNIIEYEKQFGIKLPLTPDLQKLWDENISK